MDTIDYALWALHVDRAATRRAYAETTEGGADTCICTTCQNWVAARRTSIPGPLLELLELLAIDPTKDVEVVDLGLHTNGLVNMGGWFAFVGRITAGPDQAAATSPEYFDIGAGVNVCFKSACALLPPAFEGLSVASVHFDANLPWLLDAPFPGLPGCS